MFSSELSEFARIVRVACSLMLALHAFPSADHLSDSMDERVARKLQSSLTDTFSTLHGGAASSLIDVAYGIRGSSWLSVAS